MPTWRRISSHVSTRICLETSAGPASSRMHSAGPQRDRDAPRIAGSQHGPCTLHGIDAGCGRARRLAYSSRGPCADCVPVWPACSLQTISDARTGHAKQTGRRIYISLRRKHSNRPLVVLAEPFQSDPSSPLPISQILFCQHICASAPC